MKRFMVVAAAVVSFFSVGLMIAPAAQASTTCAGVKVHLQVYGSDLVNLCVPG